MLTYLTIGTILGLSAGLAPGPLLTLVVSETLQHGIRAGVRVALAPILTDLPIVMITVFILAELTDFQPVLGFISVVGAGFICYLGVENMKVGGIDFRTNLETPKSLRKAFFTNLLSPHPYLFWMTVGAPTTLKAMAQGLAAAVAFIVSFYLLLVGSKIGLAFLVGKSRFFLQGGKYVFTMRILGLMLIILAAFLLRDGLHLLDLF